MPNHETNDLDKTVQYFEHLMSRFVLNRKMWIARAIVAHLEKLQLHAPAGRRESYATMLGIWQSIVMQMERPDAANDEVCLSSLLENSHHTVMTQPA